MKSLKNKYVALFLALASLGACTSIEDYPDGRLDDSEIFTNQKRVAGYLNSCYTAINTNRGNNWGDNTFLASATDEAHDVGDVTNGNVAKWNKGFLSPYSNPLASPETWDYYESIRRCNVFLANIDNATVSLETERESYRGQVYGLRAFYYLQLIKNYGGVPIVLDDASAAGYDYSKLKKNTFSECVRQILSDCDKVLKNGSLLWHSGKDNGERYKWSKAMSAAVMSQAALYAASPLNNDGTLDWSEAATICKEALDSCLANGYSLFTSSPTGEMAKSAYGAYDLYFVTATDVLGNEDPETIMVGTNQLNSWAYCGLPIVSGQSRAGSCPSQELIDCYETIDGKMPILGYSDADHLQPIVNPEATLYDASNPYANRDPRLAASVYYNGAPASVNDTIFISTADGGNCALSSNSVRNTRTGYYMRKFCNPKSDRKTNRDGYFRIFRLAELYLNYAEALNEAGGSKAAVAEAMNAVRLRAGMPELDAADVTQERVRNERRVEFAFEEQRFYDVRRWKILDQTDRVVTGMKVDAAGNCQRFVVDRRSAYDSKYLRFPIPGDEVIRLFNLTGINFQNEGW